MVVSDTVRLTFKCDTFIRSKGGNQTLTQHMHKMRLSPKFEMNKAEITVGPRKSIKSSSKILNTCSFGQQKFRVYYSFQELSYKSFCMLQIACIKCQIM